MATDDETSAWFMRLTCRPNISNIGIPYIPMPMKEIGPYTKLVDYATKRIKMIETIGILEPVDTNMAFLISTTDDPKCTLQLAIGHLPIEDAYSVNEDDVCGGLRHEYDTVKVFGTLQTTNEVVVLVVDSIIRVEDFVGCEKTLAIMAKYARTKYSMYNYYWNKNRQLLEYIRRIPDDREQIHTEECTLDANTGKT